MRQSRDDASTLRYVLDAGALVAAERRKPRAAAFFRLARIGRARLFVPMPVVAEWWRGRSDLREHILDATEVVAPVPIAKAAGVALGQMRKGGAALTVDAIVMATAAVLGAIVVTGDTKDFEALASFFPSVSVLSV